MSLKIIEKLNKNAIRCSVLTKGVYPRELADIKRFSSENEYGITLVSLNEDFRNKFEPHAAMFNERIASLRYLHNKGLSTWVSMEPYPTPNIVTQNINTILNRISFVDKIVFGRWNYSSNSSDYRSCKEYYNTLAHKVIAFCRSKGISYHIKKGTQVE
jgi:DNA repair photolyase